MAEPNKPATEKTPKGYEVPVPKRGEFFSNLKKLATPKGKASTTAARGARKK